MPELTKVSIQPGVSILSVLRHLNYRPWFAMAEFVDNSLQSYLSHAPTLKDMYGPDFRLNVNIEFDATDGGRITVRDNAAGIHQGDYVRAFRPAEIPPDRSGLSEFGMGMKSAACWFARMWSVRTSALGEPFERTIYFDIDRIVRDDLSELEILTEAAEPTAHYTEIVLWGLHKPPHGRTIGKIKEHLASIYRIFLRDDIMRLYFNGDRLSYPEPPVLDAPHFQDLDGEVLHWQKDLDLDFGLGLRAHGFAALREPASVSEAGFALFRRNRLIQGSKDEAYRPEVIFGKSNSYIYQRLFGELHLEGFEVSHTKDGFRWEEHEDIVLEVLKASLNAAPLQLLSQATGHRALRWRTGDVSRAAEVAVTRTGEALEQQASPALQQQLTEDPTPSDPTPTLPPAETAVTRTFEIELASARWLVDIEITNDVSIGEWVGYRDEPILVAVAHAKPTRRLGVRMSAAHPFTRRFGGPGLEDVEPLLRFAVALVLAETTARDAGVRSAGTIRQNVNQLLRTALSDQ